MRELHVRDRASRASSSTSRAQVREAVRRRRTAAALVYVPHTTAGVTINEHADPAVARDFEAALERIVPEDWAWQHVEEGEENAPTHIRAAFMGPSVLIPMRDGGELALGPLAGRLLLRVRRPARAHRLRHDAAVDGAARPLITLGVGDLARARRFYEALGWTTPCRRPGDDVVFFQAAARRRARGRDQPRGTARRGRRRLRRRHSGAAMSARRPRSTPYRGGPDAGGTEAREPGRTFWGGLGGVRHPRRPPRGRSPTTRLDDRRGRPSMPSSCRAARRECEMDRDGRRCSSKPERRSGTTRRAGRHRTTIAFLVRDMPSTRRPRRRTRLPGAPVSPRPIELTAEDGRRLRRTTPSTS